MDVRGVSWRWWRTRVALACALAIGAAMPLAAQTSIHGLARVQTRGFLEPPLLPGQVRHDLSVTLRPSVRVGWGDGTQSLTLEPLLRWDEGDGVRRHVDVRAMIWERSWAATEIRVGIGRVFWGVAESQHLVDIVNQRDLVERPNRKEKLGQPMVDLALLRTWGRLDLYVLPGFRERRYPGGEGRLRGSLPVASEAEHASRAGRHHVDLAARWSRGADGLDVAVSAFRGTSRDPVFRVDERAGQPTAVPRYEQIDQLALEARYAPGPWSWRLEALTRGGLPDGRYWAMVGGLERTTHGTLGSAADLALVAEYHYDDRGRGAPTPFQDDVYVGARLVLNDPSRTRRSAWDSCSTRTRAVACTWPRHTDAWLGDGPSTSSSGATGVRFWEIPSMGSVVTTSHPCP